MAHLLLKIEGKEEKFPVTQPITRIGRIPTNHVTVPGNNASREHCEIRQAEHDYRLVDLASRNGTLVNGHNIFECRLYNGDRIRIGSVEIVFRSDESSPQQPRPFLKVDQHGKPPHLFELDDEPVTAGRHKSNRLALNHDSVSSRHGEFQWKGGDLHYRDLGGTNGTVLGGEFVGETDVAAGSTLEIGEVKVEFRMVRDTEEMFEMARAEEQAPEPATAAPAAAAKSSPASATPSASRLGRPLFWVVAAAVAATVGLAYLVVRGTSGPSGSLDIPNGNFELPTASGSQLPPSWSSATTDFAKVSLSEQSGAPGKALEIRQTGKGAAGAEMAVWSEKLYKPAPDILTVQARTRLEEPDTLAGFRIDWQRKGEPSIASSTYWIVPGETDWKPASFRARRPPWADSFRLACVSLGGSSRAWFDNVALQGETQPSGSTGPQISGGRLLWDAQGCLAVLEDLGPVLLWDGGLRLGRGEAEADTGQPFFEVLEPSRPDNQTLSLRGHMTDPGSGGRIKLVQRVTFRDKFCDVQYQLTGENLAKLDWLEFHVRASTAGMKAASPVYVLDTSGFQEKKMTFIAPKVQAMVLGQGDGRLVFVPSSPVEARGTEKTGEGEFALRSPMRSDAFEFQFRMYFGVSLSRGELEELQDRIREAETSGRLSEAFHLYHDMMKQGAYDPEIYPVAAQGIEKLSAQRAQAQQLALSALERAEKSREIPHVEFAGQAMESFLSWLTEEDREKFKPDQGRLQKLWKEIAGRKGEREAKEILERAAGFREKGQALLATECLRYVIEQFPQTSWAEQAQSLIQEIQDDAGKKN